MCVCMYVTGRPHRRDQVRDDIPRDERADGFGRRRRGGLVDVRLALRSSGGRAG